MNFPKSLLQVVPLVLTSLALVHAEEGKSNAKIVADEHAGIGLVDVKNPAAVHTTHPDAQWYPEAGLGLFLHWSIPSAFIPPAMTKSLDCGSLLPLWGHAACCGHDNPSTTRVL